MATGAVPMNPLRSGGGERTRYVGWFEPNGASNPVNFFFAGNWVTTIVREAAGQFLLTVRAEIVSGYSAGSRRIAAHDARLQNNGATGNRAYIGDGAPLGATFVFRVHTVDVAGASIQLGPASNLRVHIWLDVDES